MAELRASDMTTYRRADGGLIGGEYKFVEDIEYDIECINEEVGNEPLDVVEERWVRLSARTLRIYPNRMLCLVCDGEGEVAPVDEPTELAECRRCGGTGEEPLAGQTIEVQP